MKYSIPKAEPVIMKTTAVTNNINNGSVLFKCPCNPLQHDSETWAIAPETKIAVWISAINHYIILM